MRNHRGLPAVTAGVAALLALIVAKGSGAAELSHNVLPGPVPAEVIRIIDGDTIVVRVQPWLGLFIETHVRLEGLDAPELHGHCNEEIAMAQQARLRLATLLADGQVVLQNIRNDKYGGRVDARVISASGTDVAEVMISDGLARRYHGERRLPWCVGTG
jgi:endonuclease YncB( thermonuclease family)